MIAVYAIIHQYLVQVQVQEITLAEMEENHYETV